jgi:curved DNA-binding protein CbpA
MPEAIPDYYKILGVSPTTSIEEIRRAFIALQNKYHPDRYKGADANERTIEINQAWEWLRSPERRAMYDAYRREQSGESLSREAAEELIDRLARQKRQENEEELRRRVEQERERLKREAEQLADEVIKKAKQQQGQPAQQQPPHWQQSSPNYQPPGYQQRQSGGFSNTGPFRPSSQYMQSGSIPPQSGTQQQTRPSIGNMWTVIIVTFVVIVLVACVSNLFTGFLGSTLQQFLREILTTPTPAP